MVWGITEEQNEQIVNFISENPYCGIVAPTGSGKSTTMIETLYKKGGAEKIFITEPTVPAAEGLYKYMSNILGKENVGFAAEGNVKYSGTTPVVYCTAGHLRRKMLSYFENGIVKSGNIDFCSVLILDEAHNGSIDNDVIIELWIHAYNKKVTVPHLVLASATLSKESTIFRNLPTFTIKTESKPVKLEYTLKDYSPDNRAIYTDLAYNIISKNMNIPVPKTRNSKWLVFCAGSSEVQNLCSFLRDAEMENVSIIPLYSNLDGDQINKIHDPVPFGNRAIIVATNIAEASITIDGLDGVFDSLVEKVGETSSSGGLRLVIKNVSKSSAKQRMGRTGRTIAGFCFRMSTEAFYNSLSEQRAPEIARVPLTNVAIEFMNVGLDPVSLFKGRVSEERMTETLTTLRILKMIDDDNNVTELGNFATMFPLGVRNSAMIYNWIDEFADKASSTAKDDKLPEDLTSSGNIVYPKNLVTNPTKYPIYPIVVLAVLIDSFGPSYYFVPRKDETQSAQEYTVFKDNYFEEYFSKYESESDLKTLLKMWNDMMLEFKTLKPNYTQVSKWCKEHSLNNKKINEVIKVVRQCCMLLSNQLNYSITIGPFSENNVLKVAKKFLENVYSDHIYEFSSGKYLHRDTQKYFILDKRQGLNRNVPNSKKLIGLRVAEIASGNKLTSNIISLSFPL